MSMKATCQSSLIRKKRDYALLIKTYLIESFINEGTIWAYLNGGVCEVTSSRSQTLSSGRGSFYRKEKARRVSIRDVPMGTTLFHKSFQSTLQLVKQIIQASWNGMVENTPCRLHYNAEKMKQSLGRL